MASPKQGSIRIGYLGSGASFNPHHTIEKPYPGLQALVYETLIEPELETENYNVLLAKSINIYAQNNKIEIILNPNAYFHNGNMISCDDVIHSFNLLKSVSTNHYIKQLCESISLKKISSQQIELLYTQDLHSALKLLSLTPILPKEQDKYFNTILSASGPYQVDAIHKHSIQYKRVTNYWGENLVTRQGRFNITNIIYHYFPTTFDMHTAFMQNGIDYYLETSATRWAEMKQNIPEKTYTLPHPQHQYTSYIWLNSQRPGLSEQSVRCAISLFIIPEFLNQWLYHGQYTSSPHLTSRYDHSIRHALYLADKQLTASGWQYGPDNIRIKDNVALKFTIITPHSQWHPLLTYTQSQLKRIGIQLSINQVSKAQYLQHLNTQQYDMIIEPTIIDQHKNPVFLHKLYHAYESLPLTETLLPYTQRSPAYIANPVYLSLQSSLISNNHIIPLLSMSDFRVALQPNISFIHHNQSFIDIWSWWIESEQRS